MPTEPTSAYLPTSRTGARGVATETSLGAQPRLRPSVISVRPIGRSPTRARSSGSERSAWCGSKRSPGRRRVHRDRISVRSGCARRVSRPSANFADADRRGNAADHPRSRHPAAV